MNDTSKYSFHDDYSEGAHPNIIDALAQTNLSQQSGYGHEEYSEDARKANRDLISAPEATIHFTPGGTAANLISIATHLRPHESVIAAASAHIVGKEGGAIEATGHQMLIEAGEGGKLTLEMIRTAFNRSAAFAYQPEPKMVFVSNTTEIGTYANIAAVCKELDMLFLLDGARLGAALAFDVNDFTLADIYDLTDMFWIGGTKNGALLGEAVIIKAPQRGVLLAKSRVLGLARHANRVAGEMAERLVGLGFELWARAEANQVFVILPVALVEVLQRGFGFFVWEREREGWVVVRLVASWATDEAEARRLCGIVEGWMKRR
ncbi:beta-eliminating lyase [Ophiobolus disseminans]|uniref:Beta-eliminating lyase n=1 Tax=Ophiobolus disseminans TaxID=1469910 RepID=A0A6A7A6G0_9PLEO|nr:beta-eliminating lyase [Ophiobolus disseminans]